MQRVVVLQILHRLEPSRPGRHYVDPDWFNPLADDVNITLQKLLKDNDKAILWNHKSFWDHDFLACAINDDGMHIADAAQWKYIRNIRAAVVSAIKHLDRKQWVKCILSWRSVPPNSTVFREAYRSP